MRLPILPFALFLTLLTLARPARADVRENTTALLLPILTTDTQPLDRSPGSPLARKNADSIEQLAKQAVSVQPTAQTFRQSFLMTLPIVDVCRATLIESPTTTPSTQIAAATAPAPRSIPLFPLIPMGGQPPSLSSPTGGPQHLKITYAHFGTLEDLKGKDLANRIVALEINAPESSAAWERCASLGAAAILFLGNPTITTPDFLNQATTIPLGVPRFYCDDPDATAFLRAADGQTLSLELRTHWQEAPLDNIIAILPGRSPGTPPPQRNAAAVDWTHQWLILQTRYDAPSQIMSRAPGATPALNTATLLDLAQQIAAAPAHCGVVLLWTAGDEWNNRGTRAFLDLLNRGKQDPSQIILQLQQSLTDSRTLLAQAAAIAQSAQSIADHGWSPANALPAKDALEEQLLRQSSTLEEDLERARLTAHPADPSRVEDLKAAKQQLLSAINIVTGRNLAPPAPADQAVIQPAAQIIATRWQLEVRRRRAQVDIQQNYPDIRSAMPARDPLLFLSLALSASPENTDASFSLLFRSYYATGLDITGRMAPFAQAFRRYAEIDGAGLAAKPTPGRFSPDSMENRFTLESLLPIKRAFPSDAAIAQGQPAGAFATLRDPLSFFDTPNDTLDHINWPQARAQQQSLSRLLLGIRSEAGRIGIAPAFPTAPGLLTDPLLYGRADLPTLVSDQTLTLFQRAIGETLPRLKAAQALIGGESEIYNHPLGDPLAGTRRTDWYLTHADGSITFQSVNRVQEAEMRLQAFEFDDHGQPIRTLAANQSDIRGMISNFSPNADRPVRAMLFDCRRFDAFGLFDPRYLDHLEQLQILDARRLDAAQFSNIYARKGLAAVFMPPADDMQWQLLASRGNINNRMIFTNSTPQNPAGAGFTTTDRALIGPLPWRAALDFYTLDVKRKTDLEKFGISNDVIRELQSDSQKQMTLAQSAQGQNDYPAFLGAADAILALQSQEYQNLIATSNSIIKGVIFLLLGIIPFSYFLERLLIGAVNVYRQIAWFSLIFALMTAGLWFHPAFRISSTPLMILLAFFILILSSTVVYILWGKFEDEIAQLRGTGGEGNSAHVASFRRGAVLGAAVRLGLSNMRRRGLRTALTLVTLVLLTFTLLCFTSVRESVQVSPRTIPWTSTDKSPLQPPPAGILLRQRAWQDLPLQTIQLAHELALPTNITLADSAPSLSPQSGERSALVTSSPLVARRFWYASQRPEQGWLLPAQSHDKTYYLSALVGLDPAEAQFQQPTADPNSIDSILPTFSHSQPADTSCWLPEKARDILNLNVGDSVSILGYHLRVAGFFTPQSFAKLRQLTGDPLSPLDPAGIKTISTANTDPDQIARPESSYRFLDSISVAIVPAWITEQLGARLTSIIFRPPNIPARPDPQSAASLNTLATSLARRSAFTIYLSDGSQVSSINAAEASRPTDLGTVLVPMLIAGIIVLNTMLGAVAERTREIHIYTSVGLSPAHVGMLFLAEAAALGTLGVVFGYIFGQGLATLLSSTHWLPGVDLNYSSMSAIVTMGLVLAVVMLSALWPARSASRLAAPSLQRDWKLPRPIGDILSVDLPFTVNETAAKGICAFLAEFLTSTSQSGTGRFTADNLQATIQSSSQGPVRTLSARIWLAPYDLGVIQTMELSLHPAEPHTGAAGAFDVHVQLTREAGNPPAWRRLNRPFLVEIRKQFLLWRTLEPNRITHYLHLSDSLFTT